MNMDMGMNMSMGMNMDMNGAFLVSPSGLEFWGY